MADWETVQPGDGWEPVKTQDAQAKPFLVGAAGMPQAIAEVAQDFNPLSKFAIGVTGGVNDITLRIKQALGMELSPAEQQSIRDYRALSDASTAATIGNVVPKIAATARPTGMLMRGAAAVPVLRSVPSVTAAVAGAAGSAVTDPVIDGESSVDKAAESGVIAGAVDAALRGAGRVVQPIVQSEPVKKLVSEKIIPTIGQALGPNSIAGKIEQRLQSVPIVGDIITGARNRAINEMNAAALRRSVPPDQAKQITAIGRRGLEQADDIIDDGYRAVRGRIQVRSDQQLIQDLEGIAKDLDGRVPDAVRDRFVEFVKKRVLDVFDKNAPISGEIAGTRESLLGTEAARLRRSPDADLRELGIALSEAKGAIRQLYLRQASAADVAELKALNQAYTNFLRVQRASGYVGAEDGVFNPSQLRNSVRALDPSMRKGQFALGNAPMQDLSDPAYNVLRNTVANSGTPERLAAMRWLEELAKMNPKAYAGIVAALPTSLAYSRPAQRYMLGDLLPGQQVLGSGLRMVAPYAGQAAAQSQ